MRAHKEALGGVGRAGGGGGGGGGALSRPCLAGQMALWVWGAEEGVRCIAIRTILITTTTIVIATRTILITTTTTIVIAPRVAGQGSCAGGWDPRWCLCRRSLLVLPL